MRSIKSIQLLFGLFVICTAAELNPDGLRQLEQQNCGIGIFKENLILGGYEVFPGSRPWMALIRAKLLDTNSAQCTGTLITDQFVLTAAHCVMNVEITSMQVNLTTDVDCNNSTVNTNCLPNIESFGIESVIIHEKFESPRSFPYDIALIKLKRKVDFKEHNSPICLPVNATLEKEATSRETLIQTGWGFDNHGLQNDKMYELIVNNSVANQTCGPLIPVKSENLICFSSNSETLCKGTSGNPLSSQIDYSGMKRFVQLAIVSAGYRNCNPSVGINVARFMPWITNVLAKES